MGHSQLEFMINSGGQALTGQALR